MFFLSPLLLTLQLQPDGIDPYLIAPQPSAALYSSTSVGGFLSGSDLYLSELGYVAEDNTNLDSPLIVRTSRRPGDGSVAWEAEQVIATQFPADEGYLARRLAVSDSSGLVVSAVSIRREVHAFARLVADGSLAWTQVTSLPPGQDTVALEVLLSEPTLSALVISARDEELLIQSHDLATGDLLWSSSIDDELSAAAPVVSSFALSPDGLTLYAGNMVRTTVSSFSFDTQVTALDVSNGEHKWVRRIPKSSSPSIAVRPDGTRIGLANVASYGPEAIELNAQDGSIAWRQTLAESAFNQSSAVLYSPDGSAIAVAFGEQSLVDYGTTIEAFESPSGQPKWAQTLGVSDPQGFLPVPFTTLSGKSSQEFLLTGKEYLGINDLRDSVQSLSWQTGTASAPQLEEYQGQETNYERVFGVDGQDRFVAVLRTATAPPESIESLVIQRRSSDLQSVEQVEPLELLLPAQSRVLAAELSVDGSSMIWVRLTPDNNSNPALSIECTSAVDGSPQWSTELDSDPSPSGVQVAQSPDGQRVYVAYSDGLPSFTGDLQLFCVDALDGQVLWEQQELSVWGSEVGVIGSDSEKTERVATEDRRYLLATNSGLVYSATKYTFGQPLGSQDIVVAMNADGTERWRHEAQPESGIWANSHQPYLAICDDRLMFVQPVNPTGGLSIRYEVIALNLDSGVLLDSFALPEFRYVRRMVGSSSMLALTLGGPNQSADAPGDQALLFDPDLMGAVESATGSFARIVRLSPELGFAFIEADRVQQLGSALQFPGWVLEGVTLDPDRTIAVEEGEALLSLEISQNGQLDGTCYDALEGRELWKTYQLISSIDASAFVAVASAPDSILCIVEGEDVLGSSTQLALSQPYLLGVQLPSLLVDPKSVSLITGGTLSFELRLPRPESSQTQDIYFLLAGTELSSAGPQINGLQIPFAPTDPLLSLFLTNYNTTTLHQTLGVLSSFGNTDLPQVVAPAGLDPALQGEDFFFAALRFETDPLPNLVQVTHATSAFVF